jgi:hypothetical protein
VTRAMDFEEGVADRPRTPERQSRRTGDNYDVSVVCTPGDDEVRWEVVIRRAPEYGGAVPPPGPLALVGPTGSNTASQSRTHAPSLASSINLSLGLDVEQPTGKLVFIALPDANSTPTRARPSTMSPRASLSGASSHTTPPVPPAPAPAPAPALAAPSALPSPLPQPPQPPVRSSPAVGSNSSAEGGTPPSSRSPVSVSQTSLPATPELPSAPGDTPTLPVPQRQRKRHGVQDLFAISTTNVAPPPPPRRDHRRGASLSPYTPSSASSTASPIFVMTGTPVASRAGTPRLSSSTFASSRPLPLPPRPDRPLRLQSSGSASSSISTGSVGSVGSIAPSPVAALLGSVAPSPNTPHTPHTNGLPQPPVPVQTPTPPPHALPSPPVSTGPKAMPPLPAVPLPAVPLPSDPLRAVPHPAVPLPAVPAPNGRHASPNRLPIPPTAQP